MANRAREDDKNEKIIRNLLKLPENRRCINCNSLGPQYVCTNFSTFICTTCSGIHREFTHRVKSVSMAKFTSLEVSALQGGGNASAREIYLKEWDPQRNSLPDGRNVERLRDFIKHVYVDRRFTGERILDKPPRDKMAGGETEGFNGNRGVDTYQGGSRSPSYDNKFEQRHGDRPSSGGRSPENWQSRDYRRTPGNTEVVNDWRREDRFGNGRRSGRSSDDELKVDGQSPGRLKDPELPSSPEVRPVRDILRDNVLPLRVIEPPNVASGKSTDGSMRTQRIASSSSIASSDGNPSETKVDVPFIDFDSAPVVTAPQIHQTVANESSIQHTTSSNNDWANFDSMTGAKLQSTSSNPLESMLSEFPISTSTSPSPGLPAVTSVPPYGSANAPSVLPPVTNPSSVGAQPQFNNTQSIYGTNSAISASRPQNSVLPGYKGQPLPQTVAHATGLYPSSKALNPQAQMVQQPPRPSVFPGASNESSNTMGDSHGSALGSSLESNSSGRKALPEDLFSMNYAYRPSPASGWYPIPGSPYIPGMPLQYSTPVAPLHVHNIPAPARSRNPFEVGNEPSQAHASTFPSVASLQGALPEMANLGIPHAPGHIPPQHNTMPMPSQTPFYPTSAPQSSIMGQGTFSGAAARPQVPSSFGSGFPSLNPHLQHATHPASSSFTSGGNPFG